LSVVIIIIIIIVIEVSAFLFSQKINQRVLIYFYCTLKEGTRLVKGTTTSLFQ